MGLIVMALLLICVMPAYATSMELDDWYKAMQTRPLGAPDEGSRIFQISGCPACHGKDGVPESKGLPVLAGQRSEYLYKLLLDYKAGRVEGGEVMTSFLAHLDNTSLSSMAAWLSELPRPKPIRNLPPPPIIKGDRSRLIPPCESCHGADGQGWKFQPAIRGQDSGYLEYILFRFKNGSRTNDINASMRFIARKLSDDEIRRVADHFGR